MLSVADNELISCVEPGSSMGGYMREHWIPVGISDDLIIDDRPMRVRLLGEDLILFRDSEGRVGLLQEGCAHRCASLAFGRNERGGLRCIYHGWKFDVEGNCLDMPNEPEGSTFHERVRQPSYPTCERNGVVWAYMGGAAVPGLPELELNLVPSASVFVRARVMECNWLQALEGSIDSSHGPFLHGRVGEAQVKVSHFGLDRRPRFEVQDADFGLLIGAKRSTSDPELSQWRVHLWMFPFYTLIPPSEFDTVVNGQAWVPMDNEHTLVLSFAYHPTDAFPPEVERLYSKGRKDGTDAGYPSDGSMRPYRAASPYPQYWPKNARDNDFGLDLELQRERYFSGVPGLWTQDAACTVSMGSLVRRENEHLGASDLGIARMRRRLLAEIRGYEKSRKVPAVVAEPSLYRARPVGRLVDEPSTLADATGEFVTGRIGMEYGYTPY